MNTANPRRFRYSLRTLFVVVTVAGVYSAAWRLVLLSFGVLPSLLFLGVLLSITALGWFEDRIWTGLAGGLLIALLAVGVILLVATG